MGIDIWAVWKGQTSAEADAQKAAWLQDTAGS
jgi:hypothetical protein